MRYRLLTTLLLGAWLTAHAQNTPASQMEKLERGVVAVPTSTGGGNLVTWRLMGTEDEERTTFNLLRDGKVLVSGLKKTNYRDAGGTSSSTYQVVTLVDGQEVETSKSVLAWDKVWKKLVLDRPAGGSNSGGSYDYSPNDCSVGDVDGDGEYEIFVKWAPSNAKDNSQSGITGNVYLDCYKLDGTKLWRIDLGRNIRAGAHYTQFMVYDFDKDGRAELMCKTAPGSKDGTGSYVNQAATDENIKAASNTKSWVTSDGRIDGGQEYLTVFEGLTGKALHTIAYYPNRNGEAKLSEATGTYNWGAPDGKTDRGSYGNRGERYLAAVAYLDGPDEKASGIFSRGYYGYAYIWAVGFDGQKLYPKWLHKSVEKTSYSLTTFDANGGETTKSYSGCRPTGTAGIGSGTMFGNGNHNLSIGDVDGDGCDEIIWGSAGLNNDGTLLYGTGYGHGDAIHMGAMIPGRKGMQVFEVHEDKLSTAWDLHDAATGEILQKGGPEGQDNGRGMAAQLSANTQEWWFSSSSDRNQRSAATGEVASSASSSVNFRMYWDGTLQDALLDGNTLNKYSDASKSFVRLVTFYNLGPGSTCNGTKNTPNLSADILGDWREELILYSVTDAETYLGIYSTNIETSYVVPTLMHDHTYRMGICWQNTAYNQPPHLGYNLPASMVPHFATASPELYAYTGQPMTFTGKVLKTRSVMLTASFTPDGTRKAYNVPDGFERPTFADGVVTLNGTPEESGDYLFAFRLTGNGGEVVNDTLTVHVSNTTGIETTSAATAERTTFFDAAGHQLDGHDLNALPRGIYIVKKETDKGNRTYKIIK